MGQALKGQKRRIIFFVGAESHYRKAICASEEVGTHRGLTWISQGIKSRSWWTERDDPLIAEARSCTPDMISLLYQGSLTLTGVGEPLGEQKDVLLECFDGYTATSLNKKVQDYLMTGYPETDPNRTGIVRPHDELVNLALDGVCIFAKTMQHFIIGRRYDVEDLRTPRADIYRLVVNYMKDRLGERPPGQPPFASASGGSFPIRDTNRNNDFANHLAIWQTFGNRTEVVGYADLEGNRNLSYATGLRNDTWEAAPDDVVIVDEQSFPVLAVVIPTLAIFFCGIVCYAAYSGRQVAGGTRSSNQA